MQKDGQNMKFFSLLCLNIALLLGFILPSSYFGFASLENRTTTMESAELNNMSSSSSTNDTNIVLVHGIWSDGSIWSKVIPILQDARHRVIAARLPLRSLGDDVATVKRAIEQLGKPTILVGHSYGGDVTTNAGYDNPNVTGLVYIAALAPDEGETGYDLVKTLPQYEKLLQMFSNNIVFYSNS
jgi:pimeloyl-ACP methyl ester carboxylesterase